MQDSTEINIPIAGDIQGYYFSMSYTYKMEIGESNFHSKNRKSGYKTSQIPIDGSASP